MSQKDTQRERTDTDADDFDDVSFGSSSSRDRVTVSDRSSWTGLAKRAYNVTGGGGRTDVWGATKLSVAMILGAVVAGFLPIPLLWIVGLGAGAAVAGKFDAGSMGVATLVGAVLGFVGGLGFAAALFGLGILLTLVTTVLGAVVGAVGHLAGRIA